MTVGQKISDAPTFKMKGAPIKNVQKLRYLGMVVIQNGSVKEWTRQVKNRANCLLHTYYKELTSYNLSIRLKLDILNSLVVSLCRFGEEVQQDEMARSLSTVQAKGVRLILGQK